MLTFRDIAKDFHPLRWVQQTLIFSSVLGYEKLTSTPFCSSVKELDLEYDRMDYLVHMSNTDSGNEFLRKATHIIGAFRNIKGTLSNIEKGTALSELELFEVKYFSYYYECLSALLKEYDLQFYDILDLSVVFQLLDPDKTGVVSFYLYDSYDSTLAELRKKTKDNHDCEDLYSKIETVGYTVRETLSLKLKTFYLQLTQALDSVARWDLLIAKVVFAKETTFCRPSFSGCTILSYEGLQNPYLSDLLSSKGEKYQPINISLNAAPTLITGANMSGKTMILKSIALAQYLTQFGFYAPARKAQVSIVEEVIFLIGDSQNENKGLSSFGAEILTISEMIESVYKGKKILALLDEPARTTSPDEGVTIVNAIIELLAEQKVISLITTHYNKLKSNCRCLRVKGFVEELVNKPINCNNIGSFIDYSLVESKINEGSSEALTVAKLLKVSDKLLNKMIIEKENK